MATFVFGRHSFRIDTVLQAVLDFGFIIVGIFIASAWLSNGLPVDIGVVFSYSMILALTMTAVSSWLGLYQRIPNRRLIDSQARAVLALHLSLPIAYLIYIALPFGVANWQFLQLSSIAAVFGVLVSRIRVAHGRGDAMIVDRLLIYGVGSDARDVAASINSADPTVRIVGFFAGISSDRLDVPADQVLSRKMSLIDTVTHFGVDQIVIAISDRRGGRMPMRELLDCRISGVRVLDRATYFERMLGQIRLDALKAGWLIFGEGFSQGTFRTVIKRLFDIVAASVLLVLAAPVMLVAAILIVLEDGFPVLYKQERVGLNGRLFNVIKFRSMRRDAEADGKPRWATAKDDRATRTGRIFRKLRIDELPQLYSVLKGDMSMVGPRPERAFFVDQLSKEIPFYLLRHSVKPGVTGWAQVRYHYGASVGDAEQKLQYDLYYVKNHSLIVDLVILFETVGVVLGGKGAQ